MHADGKSKVMYIKQYMLAQRIGQGSFGTVRIGKDCETDMKVAAKIFTKANLTAQALKAIQREIGCMQVLRHRNVVQLFDVVQDEEHIVLIIELAKQGQLVVPEQGFTEEKAQDLIRQLIIGLQHCHRRQVAHLDIKPANIFMAGDTLKLGDFGLAMRQDVEEKTAIAHGSPRYVAPEVFTGQGFDGFAVDMWACGVTLFNFLTGGFPFDLSKEETKTLPDRDYIRGMKRVICKAEFRFPASVSPQAQDLVRRMLTKDLSQRITPAEVLIHPWMTTDLSSKQPKPLSRAVSNGIKKVAAVFSPRAVQRRAAATPTDSALDAKRAHSF